MKQIQKEHVALVIKYTGISFITGWLSHGFFSGERQIITSLVWIWFFIVGTLLEQKSEERDYMRTIIFSSVLAVSIWALTWGLQHFPDSPGRSLWIVPLWFLISVYAYVSLEKENFMKKTHILYTIVWFILFIVISLWFYWVVAQWYIWGWWHGHWSEHHDSIEDTDMWLNENLWKDILIIDTQEGENHFKWDWHDDHSH